MSKLKYEDKIKIYEERKKGETISNLSSKYKVQHTTIKYLIRLIDKHGFDILRTIKNKYYSPYQKKQIINRVLINNESINFVSIEEGLANSGMLANWIKDYKNMGYNIIERKRGRGSTMLNKPKETKKTETKDEEIIRLRKENEYLRAEIEYSKKLRAVVQARKNRQQKKK